MDQQAKREEFLLLWAEAGGLVTQKVAAMLSGLAAPQIKTRADNGELKEYRVPEQKTVMYSLIEVLKIEKKKPGPKRKPSLA